MKLIFSREVSERFTGLGVYCAELVGVNIDVENHELPVYISEAVESVKKEHVLESLVQNKFIRAYRDFFWRIGIDPTKTRPSAEALLRRVLAGKDFPRINPLVDVYNVVSMQSLLPIAAFDVEKLKGELLMRFAEVGESFLGIGMDKPVTLTGKEVVVRDDEKLVAIYPYRDADVTKVTSATRHVFLMVCGVPGIDSNYLQSTGENLVKQVMKFCGGTPIIQYLAVA
ncbi:MAG: phenylalanine--tRNA ligase beta subunit-related protein [Candidatus Caldarchaeum sp.]|uniref:B3/B4 tRNA-binding domain-containing protein n=1 Tax=Caldiarchaeum subterraneum TaxID=311458 RepID=A0A7C4E2L8_CALS0|nr:phenylalanine--tRNA ligase beta subunit-related protein [Candidatus Caldarchaeales archaeon]MDJ0273134.1 phenylalanine--tRNA ligase beta subunit-related protein [Candidatus Caldarchaeales archaeon]